MKFDGSYLANIRDDKELRCLSRVLLCLISVRFLGFLCFRNIRSDSISIAVQADPLILLNRFPANALNASSRALTVSSKDAPSRRVAPANQRVVAGNQFIALNGGRNFFRQANANVFEGKIKAQTELENTPDGTPAELLPDGSWIVPSHRPRKPTNKPYWGFPSSEKYKKGWTAYMGLFHSSVELFLSRNSDDSDCISFANISLGSTSGDISRRLFRTIFNDAWQRAVLSGIGKGVLSGASFLLNIPSITLNAPWYAFARVKTYGWWVKITFDPLDGRHLFVSDSFENFGKMKEIPAGGSAANIGGMWVCLVTSPRIVSGFLSDIVVEADDILTNTWFRKNTIKTPDPSTIADGDWTKVY